jgi:hypothetical protein
VAKLVFKNVAVLACLLAISAVPARASQKDKEADEQKELEKKTLVLLNDLAAGAWGLKLPENRLFIMSNAADLLWSIDEKRARTLYWDALNTLNVVAPPPVRRAGQKLSQDERLKIVQSYLSAFELRQKLLRKVAKRDAQLALDMLRASRPVPPRNVMPEFTLPDDLQLEQGIAAELAARDPAQALQIARQSLAKGLSLELLNLMQRLNDVDAEKGSQFAGDIVAKLRTVDLGTDYQGAIIAAQLLHYSGKPDGVRQARLGRAGGVRALNLGDEQKRALIEELTDAALSATVQPHVLWQVFQVMHEIEQFFPERSEAVAKKVSTLNRRGSRVQMEPNVYDSIISRDTLEAARRYLGTDSNSSVYQLAIMAVAQEKSDWFREIVDKEIKDESTRAQLFDVLDSEEIYAAAFRKQIDRLRELLPKIHRKEERARAMAELALLLHEKGEKEDAVAMLDEAAALIKTDLKDEKQTNALLTLMCAFAVVDPPKAFAFAERTVDRANTQIALLLLLDKVAKTGAVKKNEIVLEQPQLMTIEFLVFKYGKGVAALAKADFNRTKALTERFDRNELRLMAQLFVLRGLLDPPQNASTATLTSPG